MLKTRGLVRMHVFVFRQLAVPMEGASWCLFESSNKFTILHADAETTCTTKAHPLTAQLSWHVSCCASASAVMCVSAPHAGPTIPSAVNIPLDLLSDVVRAGQLDPYHSGSVAVVCASGQRSAQATVRLSKVFGFKNVVNVTGGMAAWQRMVAAGSGGGGGGGGCGCGSSSGGCGH